MGRSVVWWLTAVLAWVPLPGWAQAQIQLSCGGGGGGRPNLAQAGGRDGAALEGALAQARQGLVAALT